MISGEEEEGGRGSLSLTEMLLKELEAEVLKPNQQAEDDHGSYGREALTPPPLIRNWQSVLLKPDDEAPSLTSVKSHSFREVLEGAIHDEDQRQSMSSMMDNQFSQALINGSRSSVPTTTSVTTHQSFPTVQGMTRPPPGVHSFVRAMAPMMNGPPPAVSQINGPSPSLHHMNGPPPSIPLMNGPPPLMSGPPPSHMMTAAHGAMMNFGYHTPAPMINMMHAPPPLHANASNNSYMPYFTGPGMPHHNLNGHMNPGNDLLKYQPLPISVAAIPDTTLASQLKGKKKKRQRRQESRFDEPASPVVAPAAPSPPLLPSKAPPLSSTLRNDLPPLPEYPPPPPNPAPASPAKSSSLKHVKEHKIVMKVQSRTLNESTLKIKPFEIKKKSIVADYCTDSDGESEKRNLPDSEKKKSLHDPITSLRLGDNEALPDLYSKLRKLNKELAMLKPHSSSDSSSSSDEGERNTDRNQFSKPVKITELNNDSMDDEPGRTVDNTDSLSCGPVSHVIPGLSTVRSKLDTRIKMMLDNKSAPVKRSAVPIVPRLPPLPKPPPLPEKVSFRKRQQHPGPSPVAVIDDVTLKPLTRTPSPFLSKEIYHYWHKESLKFRKYCAKTRVHHVDPNSRHKFHKSRIMNTQNKPLRSEAAIGICSLLDKNLKKDFSKENDSISDDLALTDLESDFKKLEEINRQLQELDEEEDSRHERRNSDTDDDEVNSADLRRLEELKKELQKLEEEDSDGEDDDEVVNGNSHQSVALINERVDEKSKPVNKSSEANTDISTTAPSLVATRVDPCREDASRGAKRKANADLISLVMSTVMEELKKDLRASITNNLVNEQISECGALPCKKFKMEV